MRSGQRFRSTSATPRGCHMPKRRGCCSPQPGRPRNLVAHVRFTGCYHPPQLLRTMCSHLQVLQSTASTLDVGFKLTLSPHAVMAFCRPSAALAGGQATLLGRSASLRCAPPFGMLPGATGTLHTSVCEHCVLSPTKPVNPLQVGLSQHVCSFGVFGTGTPLPNCKA